MPIKEKEIGCYDCWSTYTWTTGGPKMKIIPTSCRDRLEGKCRHLGNKSGRCLDDECTFLDASVWEDCCDECLDQETCDILVARCEMVKGKPCDKCHTCEDFKKNWFIRASEMKQGGRK